MKNWQWVKINETLLSTNIDFKYNLVLSITVKFLKNVLLSINNFKIK